MTSSRVLCRDDYVNVRDGPKFPRTLKSAECGRHSEDERCVSPQEKIYIQVMARETKGDLA